MPFNLKDQFAFYGAYHRNPTNVNIHITCVPVLLATGIMLASNTGPLIRTPTRLLPLFSKLHLQPLNLGTITAGIYSGLYLYLSPNIPGLTLAPIVLSSASLSNILFSRYSATKINTIAAGVHIVSWIAQFIGHGKFEGRKPALLDNLVQAVFLAPLFVWYEVILKLGFMKNFHKEVNEMIDEKVRAINSEKKGKGKAA